MISLGSADFAWSVFMLIAISLVALWSIPAIIAAKKKHRNLTAIVVFTVIAAVSPNIAFGALIWLILLFVAIYNRQETVFIAGPKGDTGAPGPMGARGSDAYELYLSEYRAQHPYKGDPGHRPFSRSEWLESLKGKDADEIPLSASGVVTPRKRR